MSKKLPGGQDRPDPSAMSAEDWVRAELAAGDGPVEAFRFPRGTTRLLLLAGKTDVTRADIWRVRWLARWGAEQDRARVTDGGRVSISCGFIGVTAFTKRGVLRKAARP